MIVRSRFSRRKERNFAKYVRRSSWIVRSFPLCSIRLKKISAPDCDVCTYNWRYRCCSASSVTCKFIKSSFYYVKAETNRGRSNVYTVHLLLLLFFFFRASSHASFSYQAIHHREFNGSYGSFVIFYILISYIFSQDLYSLYLAEIRWLSNLLLLIFHSLSSFLFFLYSSIVLERKSTSSLIYANFKRRALNSLNDQPIEILNLNST